jgi:plasmid stabilization system protein ParE
MPTYVVTPRARASLMAIQDYLATQRDDAWPNLRADLDIAFKLIAEVPNLGFARARWTARAFRFIVVKPYVVVYDPAPRPIRVIDVIHSALDVGRVLRKGRRP